MALRFAYGNSGSNFTKDNQLMDQKRGITLIALIILPQPEFKINWKAGQLENKTTNDYHLMKRCSIFTYIMNRMTQWGVAALG